MKNTIIVAAFLVLALAPAAFGALPPTLDTPAIPVDVVGTSTSVNWTVLVPIIGASLLTLVAGIMTTWATLRNGRQQATNATALAKGQVATAIGVDGVHGLVNARLSDALAAFAASELRVAELTRVVAKLWDRLGGGDGGEDDPQAAAAPQVAVTPTPMALGLMAAPAPTPAPAPTAMASLPPAKPVAEEVAAALKSILGDKV